MRIVEDRAVLLRRMVVESGGRASEGFERRAHELTRQADLIRGVLERGIEDAGGAPEAGAVDPA